MKVLELFAGTRSIGKAFEEKGHEVFSVDWNKDFENIDLNADISVLTSEEIIQKFGHPDVIWASPDCTTFSVAAISKHRRRNEETGSLEPISEYAKFCDETDKHVLQLIKELNPTFWFIENPRGGMRKMAWMQDLPRYTVTYCKYGDTRMKPTDIWTNHPNPKFIPPCNNGDPCHEAAPRGSQTGTQKLKNWKEKSIIPEALCRHIVDICEEAIGEKTKGMKVLSLFDGISCGMVALERAGIPVERYVAYEIEESAITISSANYPQIEHCGDVFKADFTEFKGFDILIGGSPCTFWSVAQRADRRETVSEGFGWELFQQYVRALHESGCKYFLYENNKSMSDAIKAEITKHLGVEPIMINSELVSAQSRSRYYWTNIPGVEVPKDKGILLKDIIESGSVDREKSLCLARRYAGFSGSQSYLCRRYFGKSFGQGVFEGDIEKIKSQWKANPYFESDEQNIRQMTIVECERLQTLPDNYTNVEGVSNQMRYEAIGNGWTVDVIAHILTHINLEKENKEMELKVGNYQLPERISFNYEELKAELEARVHMYEVMFYADDQIKDAKADRASLNKLKKALNDERIRREKEYMVPFNDFKARINEIIAIIDKPVEMIDKQVKAYEDKQKQDKLDAIITFFNEQNHQEWLHFSQIFDERWLNASVSMKSVQDAISAELVRITTDLATLADLPEFGFEATEVYKSTLDINKAISEGHRLLEIAQKKAEFESTQAAKLAEQMAEVEAAKVVEEVAVAEEVLPEIEPVHTWIAFEANMTIDDAIELRKFFDSRHIEFRALYA